MNDKRGVIFGFNEENKLCFIKIHGVLEDEQLRFIWLNLPINPKVLKDIYKKSETIKIIEIPLDLTFETFWFTYYDKTEKKAGYKTRCEKKWNKLKDITKIKALDYIEIYKSWLRQKPNIQKKYAETYLEHKEWENE